ncbi:hypothetical protein TIFTF001_023195 [Ficus carica]|uniref:Retrotransposon gag domain-containing protein n=1 Tax=Ficus carica TaxID=3494 RepID=A0AA88DF50_FICCA|nr:hypothetical protein TIFTF001_023195 [Ficus carica]
MVRQILTVKNRHQKEGLNLRIKDFMADDQQNGPTQTNNAPNRCGRSSRTTVLEGRVEELAGNLQEVMNTMHQLRDQFIELVQIQRDNMQQNTVLAINGAVKNRQQYSERMDGRNWVPAESRSILNLGGNDKNVDLRHNLQARRVDHSQNYLVPTLTVQDAQRLAEQVRTLEPQMNLEHEEKAIITHPFTPEVMQVLLPDKFKMPQVPLYDGTTDPKDHLRRYNSHMSLYVVPGEIACRAFDSTLIGAAARWFRKLRPNTIGSWADLYKAFSSHFVGVNCLPEPKEKLVTMYQGSNETLKSWIKRYTAEVSKTEDCTDKTALIGALSSMRGDIAFQKDLDEEPAKSFKDFLKQAKKYINAEEIKFLRD